MEFKMNASRYNIARKWLIFWTLFIGIGAVAGGFSMIIDPSGKSLTKYLNTRKEKELCTE